MNDLEIRELVLKIMNEAMDKTENTKADVFVDFQAHVKELVLRILKSGWKNRKVEEEIYKSSLRRRKAFLKGQSCEKCFKKQY